MKFRDAPWLGMGMAALLLASGCGDEESSANASGPVADAAADVAEDSAAPDVHDSALPDAGADVATDVEGGDAESDAGGDATPDASLDAPDDSDGSDAADDGSIATDAPSEGGHDASSADASGKVTVSVLSSDPYVMIPPMGPGGPSGTVYFTLQVDNGGASDISGFEVIDGEVDLVSTGTMSYHFDMPTFGGLNVPDPIVAGTIEEASGTGYSPSGYEVHCGQEVVVVLNVTWDGAPTISVTGDPVTLTCSF